MYNAVNLSKNLKTSLGLDQAKARTFLKVEFSQFQNRVFAVLLIVIFKMSLKNINIQLSWPLMFDQNHSLAFAYISGCKC